MNYSEINFGERHDAKIYVEEVKHVKEPHIIGLALVLPFFWMIVDVVVGDCIDTVKECCGYLYTFVVIVVSYISMFTCTFSTAIIPEVFFTKEQNEAKWWICDLVQCFFGSQICIGTLYFLKASTLYNMSI